MNSTTTKPLIIPKQPVSCHPSTIFSTALSYDVSENVVPWKRKGVDYQSGLFGLNTEIRDFIKFLSPTPDEKWARELVIARVRDCIHNLWPHASVEVCGSFQTNLYLPTSDIDLVVFGNWDPDRLPLDLLRTHLESHNIASSIKVLSRATVPIVKMIDKDTEIQVDISFNMNNSIRAVKLISEYLTQHPCLQSLVLVLKQFLQQRELNEVFTGGLGSYALILMCVSFLQHNVQPVELDKINLAVLLIEFLELYGRRFNYNTTAIRVTEGGSYCRKSELFVNSEMLCIQDPLNYENDLGRRTFAMMQVKEAFEYAYTVLGSAVFPQYQLLHAPSSRSILGRIIRLPQRTLDRRQQLQKYVSEIRLQLSQRFPMLTTPVFLPSMTVSSSANPKSSITNTSPGDLGLGLNQRVSPSPSPPSHAPSQSLAIEAQPDRSSSVTPSLTLPFGHTTTTQAVLLNHTGYPTLSFVGAHVNPTALTFIHPFLQSTSVAVPSAGQFPVPMPTYSLTHGSVQFVQAQQDTQITVDASTEKANGGTCYVNQNRDQVSCSSCSPESSSKSSVVSSGVEDSSEEHTSAPEKRRPPPEGTKVAPKVDLSSAVLPSASGDGPEAPASRLMLEDAGVKSLVKFGENSSNSRVTTNTPTPSGDQINNEWPTASSLSEEAFPQPTVVVVPKNVSRKNRSQARKFDPNHYRLRENFALGDPGIRKVENSQPQTSNAPKAIKNKNAADSVVNRSSSEETENRTNPSRFKQQFPTPEATLEQRNNCASGSKRKRVQSRKSQQSAANH